MTCAFCTTEASGSCCWPRLRGRRVAAADVRTGDRILVPIRDGKRAVTVTAIEDAGQHLVVSAEDEHGAHVEGKFRPLWDQLEVERIAACGAPACERHLQERAPGRVICQSHWRAWEAVA